MADAKATFELELDDATSGPAEDAAAALERLKAQILANQAALRDMAAAMGRLRGSSAAVTSAKKQLADRMATARSAMASAQAQYLKLGGSLSDIAKRAVPATSGLGDSLDRLGVPMGDLRAKAQALAQVFTSPAGLALGVGALSLAAVAAVGALTGLAIKLADAARSTRIYLAALAGSDRGGAQLAATIDRVARRVPVARDELKGMASGFLIAGLKGQQLADALESVATVQAAIGAGPASKLKAALEEAAKTGKVTVKGLEEVGLQGTYTYEQLRKAVTERFGAAAAAQMKSLPAQFARLQENLAGLFAGLNIDPALDALEEVLKLFDQSTSSGRALRQVAEVMFQPIINFIGRHSKVIAAFFKGMIVATLMFIVVVLKVATALKRAFGADALSGIDSFNAAIHVGIAAAMLFLMPLAMLAAALAVVALAFYLPQAAIKMIVDEFTGAYERIKGMSWSEIGTGIVDGIIAGITGAAPKAVAAMTGLGGQLLKAGKSAIESFSPSRAFRREMGRPIPQGIRLGVQDEADAATGEVASLGRSLVTSGETSMRSAQGAAGGRRPAGGGSVTIQELHVHVEGVRDTADFKSKVKPALIELLRDALRGGGLAPAPA